VRVGQRLFLAVVPAVLGVLTVAGLAYWGQYAHSAPHRVVVIAGVAAVASLAMAWLNTRYVAQRIEQLAAKVEGERVHGPRGIRAVADAVTGRVIAGPATDELDAIESVVDRYTAALARAELERSEALRLAEARIREHGELLAYTTTAVTQSLDEIRLPLHILLENRFGDLNENQEEMLEAARAAAEAAGRDVRRLTEIAELDAGARTLRRDRVHFADLVQSLEPTLQSEAARVDVRVEIAIAPALPAVLADRGLLQEAFALLLSDCVRRAPAGGQVRIAAERAGNAIEVTVEHAAPLVRDIGVAMAERIIHAHGGAVTRGEGRLGVILPLTPVVGTA
jgi:signal transduction histidine kinase